MVDLDENDDNVSEINDSIIDWDNLSSMNKINRYKIWDSNQQQEQLLSHLSSPSLATENTATFDSNLYQRLTQLTQSNSNILDTEWKFDFLEKKSKFNKLSDQKCDHDQSDPILNKRNENSKYFNLCLIGALIFRLLLLILSVWQDEVRWPDGQLRFTDIDYDVFSDAAKALIMGKNIYLTRPTYRYSPLIACILAPGYWLFSNPIIKSHTYNNNTNYLIENFFDEPIYLKDKLRAVGNQTNLSHIDPFIVAKLWGKLLFILADLCCAYIQYVIICKKLRYKNEELKNSGDQYMTKIHTSTTGLATLFICFGWLFNPFTAVISVRGNADALHGFLILYCLWCLLENHILIAGLLYGLCIHLRIYPIIYAPSIYLSLTTMTNKYFSKTSQQITKTTTTTTTANNNNQFFRIQNFLPNKSHLKFGLTTLISFCGLTWISYEYFGGLIYLNQAYFYHFTRIDYKHNFAPHFLTNYLLSGIKWKTNSTVNSITSVGLSDYFINGLSRINLLIYSAFDVEIETSDQSNTNLNLIAMFFKKPEIIYYLERLFNLYSIIPFIILIPTLSIKLYGNLGLCWFILTYTFVTFNKVCTSQYFVWILTLMPIILADIRLPKGMSPYRAIVENLLIWLTSQGLWLASAYGLEMCTHQHNIINHIIWLLVWIASLIFFCSNIFLIRRFIRWCRNSTFTYINISHEIQNKGVNYRNLLKKTN